MPSVDAVVDHDELDVRVVGVEQNALHAQPREGEAVRRDDHDRGVVRAPPEPVAAGLGNRAAERRLDRPFGQAPSGAGTRARDRRVAGTPAAGRRRTGGTTPTASSSRPSTTSESKCSRATSNAAWRAFG